MADLATAIQLCRINHSVIKKCLQHHHQAQTLINAARFNLKTLFLFTRSDIKTIILPQTLFALALTAPHASSTPTLLLSLPPTISWLWLTLLLFTIGNQTQPHSIAEDTANKPWRPIPSNRISLHQAKNLEDFLVPFVSIYSACNGTLYYSVFLYVLGYAYNALGGHRSALWRNTLCAGGYAGFGLGATAIMKARSITKHTPTIPYSLPAIWYGRELGSEVGWFGLYSAIIFTTIQVSDIPDIEGDMLQGRKTMPIVCGELVTRITSAVAVVGWSVGVALFWGVEVLPLVVFGCVVAGAIVAGGQSKVLDMRVYLMYNIWLGVVGLVPFFAV